MELFWVGSWLLVAAFAETFEVLAILVCFVFFSASPSFTIFFFFFFFFASASLFFLFIMSHFETFR